MTKAEDARKVAADAPAAARARRAEFRAKEAGKKAFASEEELVEAVTSGRVELNGLAKDKLPEKLQKMSKEEREAYIKKQAKKREELQRQIAELSEKRQEYIREQLEKENKDKPSLDDAIFQSIKAQGAKRGLKYEGGPKY